MQGSELISIYSSDTILEIGTYQLKGLDNNQKAAYKTMEASLTSITYETTNEVTGELRITKIDKTNNIISGTFWFDDVNQQGKKVEVREGRFDMVFEGWAG